MSDLHADERATKVPKINIQGSPHTKVININFDDVSLRDFFAGCALIKALPGSPQPASGERTYGIEVARKMISESCYLQADAMLAAREKSDE